MRSDRAARRKATRPTARRSCAGRRSSPLPNRAAMQTPQVSGIRRLVGNTPLLAIDYAWRGRPRTVYAKAEHMNLTGSIKDRMALSILEEALRDGRLEPGDTIA